VDNTYHGCVLIGITLSEEGTDVIRGEWRVVLLWFTYRRKRPV